MTSETLDRMTRSASSRVFQCDRPWRAPHHRSALGANYTTTMKRLIIPLTLSGVVTSIVLGFSNIKGFIPSLPPRSLPEAYSMALQALGSATNDYYCVDAKIGHDWCYAGEWVFTFDKNSHQHKIVFVAMRTFDTHGAGVMGKSWLLTEIRDTGVILNTTNAVSNK
jgi:hypothetical protein